MSSRVLDAEGWFIDARRVASPNCDPRPADTAISLVVIHGISLPPGEFGGGHVEALFQNRLDPDTHPYFREIAALRVSAHLFVRRDGELVQFVPCALRAWHAGASCWDGRERCNDFSIGIELEGTDSILYADAQYGTLLDVLRALVPRYPIQAIAGHAHVAPGRKTDPGPAFEWQRLRAVFPGLSIPAAAAGGEDDVG